MIHRHNNETRENGQHCCTKFETSQKNQPPHEVRQPANSTNQKTIGINKLGTLLSSQTTGATGTKHNQTVMSSLRSNFSSLPAPLRVPQIRTVPWIFVSGGPSRCLDAHSASGPFSISWGVCRPHRGNSITIGSDGRKRQIDGDPSPVRRSRSAQPASTIARLRFPRRTRRYRPWSSSCCPTTWSASVIFTLLT